MKNMTKILIMLLVVGFYTTTNAQDLVISPELRERAGERIEDRQETREKKT